MKKASWLVVLLLGTAVGQAQQLRTLKDVVYGKIGERELTLDAYLWDGATLAPAVIYIHGGGWRNGRVAAFTRFGVFPGQSFYGW